MDNASLYDITITALSYISSDKDISEQDLKQALSKDYAHDARCQDLVERCIAKLKTLHPFQKHHQAHRLAIKHLAKGNRAIAQKLRDKKFSEAIISSVLNTLEPEYIRASAVAQKKWPSIKGPTLTQKQYRLVRFLLSRGFAGDMSYQIAREMDQRSQKNETDNTCSR